MDRDLSGWTNLLLSNRYTQLAVRIWSTLSERKQNAFTYPDLVASAHCLAGAIIFAEEAFANWCGLRMIASMTDGKECFGRWDYSTYPAFITTLFAVWKDHPSVAGIQAVRSLEVYEQVFQGWESEKSFSIAIREICDYHCDQTDTDDGEFASGHFPLFPVEILAVYRVRRELGLPIPEVDHPLLRTPLTDLPVSISPPTDSLLERAGLWVNTGLGKN